MAWNYDAARERMLKAFEDMKDLELKPLTREMNLENLGLKEARAVQGVHVYLDVTNFAQLLRERREDTEALKKLLRHLTVYQRQVERLLRDKEGAAVRIHFQGARLHFLVFKPYGTDADAVRERLELAVTLVEQVRQLAREVQKGTDIRFDFEAGVDSGESIATMNARAGSRQLLFVGSPANAAAHALTGASGERFGPGAKPYAAQLPAPEAREPLPAHFAADVAQDLKDHPLSAIDVTPVQAPIDYERLGKKVARLEEAVSLFGDVSGFTAHVEGLTTLEARKLALRHLHALRLEMQSVVEADYQGDFIQFQGDRVQGLLYGARTSGRFQSKAVEAAAALCSGIDLARELFPELASLDMACGADVGKVLVGRVGLAGDREVTVLGGSVARAAGLQDGAGDGRTAISERLHGGIEKALQAHFTLNLDRYLAELDVERLEAEERARAYAAPRLAVGGSLSSGIKVEPSAGGIRPVRSWGY